MAKGKKANNAGQHGDTVEVESDNEGGLVMDISEDALRVLKNEVNDQAELAFTEIVELKKPIDDPGEARELMTGLLTTVVNLAKTSLSPNLAKDFVKSP